MGFLTRHRDRVVFPTPGRVITEEMRQRVTKIATDAGRDAGNAHAINHGRIPDPRDPMNGWDKSDFEAANEVFQKVYYELIPEASPWSGPVARRFVDPGSTYGEVLRGLKKLHLYRGYLPAEESREEMVARLGLRHVPGAERREE